MRIDLNAGAAIPESPGKAEKSSSPHSTNRESGARASESQFSASQNSVSALAASVLEAPEVRLAKVDGLRAQIGAGTYQASSQQVASSLFEQLRTAA